jgi:ankyrin repeat protein
MSLEKPKTKAAIREAVMWAKAEEDRIEYVRLHSLKPAQERFMIAITRDEFDKVQEFLDSGEIDVNHIQSYGNYTPLIRATQFGSARMVQLLLKHGGDVRAFCIDGWSPLGHALERMHHRYRNLSTRDVETTVLALLLHGADVNASGFKGQTPLQCAVTWSRSSDLVRILLDHGADISKTDDKDFNALHSLSQRWGAASVRNKICKTMLDRVSDYRIMLKITGEFCIKNFDPDDSDSDDLHTPSELAEIYEHPELVTMLDAARTTAFRQHEQVTDAVRAKFDAQKAEIRRQRKTAVAMGLNSRLGADSALLSMGPDILGMIAKHL